MGQRYQPRSAKPAFDPTVRFVRLRRVRADGFVEFDFAIGEPDLLVELILPVVAFHEFCRANQVIRVAPVEGATTPGESLPDTNWGV